MAKGFGAVGASVAAGWLRHFLDGTGTPMDLSDDSKLAKAVKADSIFMGLDNTIQARAKTLLDSGQQVANVTSVMQNPDFSNSPSTSEPRLAFGGTQGLDISGSGKQKNGYYVGTITYVIRDIYGFYAKMKFLWYGPMMHYLQGTCGAPSYPDGAHWFADSVTVTVPFKQPVG